MVSGSLVMVTFSLDLESCYPNNPETVHCNSYSNTKIMMYVCHVKVHFLL